MILEAPSFSDLNLAITLPVLFLAGFTMVLLLLDLFIPKDRKIITAQLAFAGLVVTFILNLFVMRGEPDSALSGMYIADRFTGFLDIVVLVAGLLSVLIGYDYLQRTNITGGEFYPLLLFSITGMMLMGSSNDLLMIFIALEMLSIPLYVMSAIRPKDLKSEESGIKYFILGAFASAFFVYGAALVYGAAGTTNLTGIFAAIDPIIAADDVSLWYLLAGAGLLIVSLGFKVAVVPFHMWTPDVYEGAPTPVAAFMSVGAKVGGFGALLRVMIVAFSTLIIKDGDTAATWQLTIALIAAATMILGNIAAVAQSNVKRLLAYSSIAHAGYIMIAVAAIGTPGMADAAAEAALIYLLAYAFTNIGAFAVVIAVEKDDTSGTELDDLNGLATSKPLLALMMAVFMLSLTGIPLTGGFIGKFLIFNVALDAGLTWLAIIGVLTSVVSAFYYVRVIVNMYLRDGEGDPAAGETEYVAWGVIASFAGTVLLGIFPVLALNLLDGMALAITSLF